MISKPRYTTPCVYVHVPGGLSSSGPDNLRGRFRQLAEMHVLSAMSCENLRLVLLQGYGAMVGILGRILSASDSGARERLRTAKEPAACAEA